MQLLQLVVFRSRERVGQIFVPGNFLFFWYPKLKPFTSVRPSVLLSFRWSRSTTENEGHRASKNSPWLPEKNLMFVRRPPPPAKQVPIFSDPIWPLLIHVADPPSGLVVFIVFAHVVRSYVRPQFSNQNKFQENNVRYWRDCGSGRVDHWWHLTSFFLCCCKKNSPIYVD